NLGDIVGLVLLIIDRREDRDGGPRLPEELQLERLGILLVDVLLNLGRIVSGFDERPDPIHPSAVMPIPAAYAHAELVLHEGKTQRCAGFVVRASALDTRHFAPTVNLHFIQVRARRDESDRAALGACAEKGALRPAQDFDALEVEDEWIGSGGGDADHA